MDRFLKNGARAIESVNRVLYWLAGALIAAMMLNVVLAVLFNKLLSRAFPIPVDYTGYLFLMAVCFGYGGYQYKNGFVRVTMLTEHFRGRLAKVVETCVFVLLFAFYLFLAIRCFQTAGGAVQSGQTMMSIKWKIWPYWYALAFGFIWTSIVTGFQTVRYIARSEL